ncbi:MAG TPA: hypothetical protein DCK93_10515 [Blastocatellia bacterium]|nr:hypothetical protein [Blastocatellia bacterium]
MLNTLTRSAQMRPLLLLVSIVIISSTAVSQKPRPVSSIQLIPQPRQMVGTIVDSLFAQDIY